MPNMPIPKNTNLTVELLIRLWKDSFAVRQEDSLAGTARRGSVAKRNDEDRLRHRTVLKDVLL